MAFLEAPRCPNCDSPLPVRDVRREAFRQKARYPGVTFAVRCPTCRSRLAINGSRPKLVMALLVVLLAALAAWAALTRTTLLSSLSAVRFPWLALPVALVGSLLIRWLTPYFAAVRDAAMDPDVRVEGEPPVPASAMDDDAVEEGPSAAPVPDVAAHAESAASSGDPTDPDANEPADPSDSPEPAEARDPSDASEAAASAGPTWQCTKCHEANSANFDVCWQCGAERSKAG